MMTVILSKEQVEMLNDAVKITIDLMKNKEYFSNIQIIDITNKSIDIKEEINKLSKEVVLKRKEINVDD